jgi:hypothetical protein
MAKAKKVSSTCAPVLAEQHFAGAILAGEVGGRVDSGRSVPVLIDGPSPQSAARWLADAVARLEAAPDCPKKVTDAARLIEKEMSEAFSRRQCDAAWDWRSIKNSLITWGLWTRTRPLKR